MGFFKRQPEASAAILITFSVAAVIIVFLPEGHILNNWLYRWSALIGGLAAVVAAFVTVTEMKMSQAEQSENHRQLIALTLREEAVSARRNIHDFLAMLLNHHTEIQSLTEKLELGVQTSLKHKLKSGKISYLDAFTPRQNLESELNKFFGFRESKEFEKVLPILDDDHMMKVMDLRIAIGSMADEIGSAMVFQSVVEDSDSWLVGGSNSLTKMASEVKLKIGLLQNDLYDLLRFYDRNSPRFF
ncbi:MAG: hypothetical protein ABJH63_12500 [Rhizobiaceae bacterium]